MFVIVVDVDITCLDARIFSLDIANRAPIITGNGLCGLTHVSLTQTAFVIQVI